MSCQSAPPARMRPERRAPSNLPPVIGMILRRPCGVAPSSCAGASVISARYRGCSSSILQEAEKLAMSARRLAVLHFLACVANEGAQRLQVGAGMRCGELGEGLVVRDEALAQRFQPA